MWKSKKAEDILVLANALALMIVINMLSSFYFFRMDLTEEGRYTISNPTRDMLKSLTEKIHIEVFLEGDLNAGFRRLQRSIRDMLEEFRMLSHNHLYYSFVDPTTAHSKKAQHEFMRVLIAKGVEPLNVIDTRDGARVEQLVFPGALISYEEAETAVMLLKGSSIGGSEEALNQSIEDLEYTLANAIYKMVNVDRKQLALLRGHGELEGAEIASFTKALLHQYDVSNITLDQDQNLEDYKVMIVAKPRSAFSDLDLWKLDQYVMKGGKLLLLIDRVDAVMDSVSKKNYYAFPYQLNLDNLLFKYGLRINTDLVQDRLSSSYPIVTGNIGKKPQFTTMRWPFFPLITHYADHVITKNMDASILRFTSSIDTIKTRGIRKTPLLFSSSASRKLSAPVNVSVSMLRSGINSDAFKSGSTPLAYLLEGRFISLYTNRFPPEGVAKNNSKQESVPTKIIVVSDGDLASNDVDAQTGNPQPLGYDRVTSYTFANQDLLLNMVAFLANENGLIRARNKQFKIRPLNKEKSRLEQKYWQVINLILPLVIIFLYGGWRFYRRKKKYAFT